MAVYILDTSITSLLERGHATTTAKYHAHAADTILVTSNTIEECVNGWTTQLRQAKTNAQRASAARSLSNSTAFLFRFPILAMTESMKIAASALEFGATVVTQNVRDFRRVPGLLWEDWTQ